MNTRIVFTDPQNMGLETTSKAKHKKTTKTMLDKLRLDNGTLTENPKEIAKALNKYFVYVGPKLAEKIPQSQKSFESYLTNSPVDSFQINPTSTDEVFKIFNSYS